MMKIGNETGSLVNHIYSRAKIEGVEPAPGVGCTILCWSDRHAGTIVKVTKTQIHVVQDKATRVDKNGLSESQTYTYEPGNSKYVEIFRKTKRGWKNKSGNGLLIGPRKEYYDFSF